MPENMVKIMVVTASQDVQKHDQTVQKTCINCGKLFPNIISQITQSSKINVSNFQYLQSFEFFKNLFSSLTTMENQNHIGYIYKSI